MLAALRPCWREYSTAFFGHLADWGALLLCAGLAGAGGATAAALLFVYITAGALMFRTALEVLALGAVFLTPWFLLRPDALPTLGPAFAVGLALTFTGCRLRAALVAHMSQVAARERQAERQRLAADFHDGPLQTFSSLQIRLALARKLIDRDPKAAGQEIERIQELGRTQCEELRAFLETLRKGPGELDFRAAVLALVQNFERESGLKVSTNGLANADSPPAEVAHELLKIIREALHNVFKHARASKVELEFARSEGALEIIVRDDGAGFPFAGSYRLDELEALRAGPESIKRRVRGFEGDLTLTSRPGSGSQLRIRLPL